MKRSILLASILLAAPALAGAQATLSQGGGVLGTSVDYALEGDAGKIYLLLPSLTTGPTPLSLFDPGDPRVMTIGLDQLDLLAVGVLISGQATVSYALPTSPSLHGVPVYAQFVTYPGSTYRVHNVSNATALTLSSAQGSTYTVGTVSKALTGQQQTVLADGRILLSGGSDYDGLVNTVVDSLEVFDPNTYSFTELTETLSQGRATHSATLLNDGRVLFCGGTDDTGNITASVDIWDPVAGTVTAATPMSVARSMHTATLLADGRVFVSGGTSFFDASNILSTLTSIHDSTEIYDPAANSWNGADDLDSPRVLHAACLDGSNNVLVTGGIEVTFTFGFPTGLEFTNECESFNPISGSMVDISDFATVRAGHAQVMLPNGNVVIAGGANGNLLTNTLVCLDSTYTYNGPLGSWTSSGTMSAPRVYPNLVHSPGAGLFVLGGVSTFDLNTFIGTPVLTVEKANAGSSVWNAAGTMLLGRPLVQCSLFDNGRRILSVATENVGLTAEVYAVQ